MTSGGTAGLTGAGAVSAAEDRVGRRIGGWDWPSSNRMPARNDAAVPVRLGVVMLCHDYLAIAADLARIWVEGGAAVAIHIDTRADASRVERMRNRLADCTDHVIWSPRHPCEWGMFSLVQATQEAASALLARFPDVTHVALVSGACLPLRPVSDLAAYLGRHAGRDFIESVTVGDAGWVMGGLGEERFTLHFPVSWRTRRRFFDFLVAWQRRLRIRRRIPSGLNPHIGSQWWCLTRRTLEAILNDPRRPEYDRYFRTVWIPDESYFQTLARLHSGNIESRSLTLAKFDSQGKPYIFYDDHIPMLEQSRCFIARKAWPRATQLMAHFPRPATQPAAADEPRPARIDRLVNAAVARRALGRPGLYMQSRYPQKDRENGKTAAPYALFQGFSDAIPGFERWLSGVLPADVHGHLFAATQVEFAGRVPVGPGALSDSAALRDYDPQGFLASLIRMGTRMQVFQYGPRDNQALNWFMTTDPNAHIAVVTGAWMLPVMRSGMPFDDIRRISARLQRRELAQLEVLRSVWTKAQVRVWELADLLARPEAVITEALEPLSPIRPLPEMPALWPSDGMGDFLQTLRNAGLRPRLTGELEVMAEPFPLPEMLRAVDAAPDHTPEVRHG